MPQATAPTIMGRIKRDVKVGHRQCWTLFDSGARCSYIRRDVAGGFPVLPVEGKRKTALGDAVRDLKESCLIPADIDGHKMEFQTYIVDEIGRDEDGNEIDLLFGALAMQGWGIRLDLENEQLDLKRYSDEFLEF